VCGSPFGRTVLVDYLAPCVACAAYCLIILGCPNGLEPSLDCGEVANAILQTISVLAGGALASAAAPLGSWRFVANASVASTNKGKADYEKQKFPIVISSGLLLGVPFPALERELQAIINLETRNPTTVATRRLGTRKVSSKSTGKKGSKYAKDGIPETEESPLFLPIQRETVLDSIKYLQQRQQERERARRPQRGLALLSPETALALSFISSKKDSLEQIIAEDGVSRLKELTGDGIWRQQIGRGCDRTEVILSHRQRERVKLREKQMVVQTGESAPVHKAHAELVGSPLSTLLLSDSASHQASQSLLHSCASVPKLTGYGDLHAQNRSGLSRSGSSIIGTSMGGRSIGRLGSSICGKIETSKAPFRPREMHWRELQSKKISSASSESFELSSRHDTNESLRADTRKHNDQGSRLPLTDDGDVGHNVFSLTSTLVPKEKDPYLGEFMDECEAMD